VTDAKFDVGAARHAAHMVTTGKVIIGRGVAQRLVDACDEIDRLRGDLNTSLEINDAYVLDIGPLRHQLDAAKAEIDARNCLDESSKKEFFSLRQQLDAQAKRIEGLKSILERMRDMYVQDRDGFKLQDMARAALTADKDASGKVGTTICRHGTPTDEKCVLCDGKEHADE
jgi:predicted RNase H-like nuclease (RuvC/YqgF family)